MYPEAGWQLEKLKREDEVVNYHWYRQVPLPEAIAEVELSKIVGTNHDSYNKGSWEQMRASLPKRSTDEQYVAMVRDNPNHSEGKQPIVVSQYGEEYILCQGGNHRVCHAKFAGLRTIRARVQQYLINPALLGTPAKPPVEAIPIRRFGD